ncbi:MAG: DNA alkylation repair protein [Candidatus Methanomethylophilaceae archaeon]|nr:DNA alkylation repair protein [Candidatus Methanomethylophilaceae archaeon]
MTRILGMLQEESDRKYRDFNKIIVKSGKPVIGVRMPALRKIASGLMDGDWRSYLSEEASVLEEDIVAALIIANAQMTQKERLALTKEFVPNIDNWAVCDMLCGDWRALPGTMGELWDYCGEMMSSGEEFKMRFAAVMMLAKFLDDDHIEGVLERLASFCNDGYYYKMGAAWALSYCYLKYQDKTEDLLRSGRLGKEVQNLTVRKVRESRRADGEMRERVKGFRL